nr:DUF1778 domain-containing protein [Rhizobium leguminosarum]
MTQSALPEADAIIAETEVIKPSERDYRRIRELLENPPQPNEKCWLPPEPFLNRYDGLS